jgi:hypothetical protein
MNRRHTFDFRWLIVSLVILSLACASTPDSRIKKQQSLFDGYARDVQVNLRMGKVDLGYDQDMVRIALGDPDETSTEVGEDGETLMWGYTRSRPGVSIGLGGGSFGGGSGMGGGVGMGSGPKKDYVAIIEFQEDKVTNARYFDN